MIRLPRLFAFLLAALLLGGCAFFNHKNRRLTNLLDEKIQPKSTVTKVLLVPVVLPLGFAALSADFLVVHPLSTLPDCFEDTARIIWRNPSGGVVQQTFLFVPKVILTPVLFLGDFIFRSLFDIK